MPDARNYGDGMVPVEQPRGFWLCRYGDWSGIAAFPTEVEALRYAVDKSMTVEFVEWGEVR
jgi:hypothetical protein